MTSQIERRRRRGRSVAYGESDLANLTKLGARTRRHKYFRDARTFALPIALAILLQTAIYLGYVVPVGQAFVSRASMICLILACVPFLSAFTLTSLRRNETPLMSAAVITAVFFSFGITALSALRLPMSYTAVATIAPFTMAIMAFGNIRFHSAISRRVAIVVFENQSAAKSLLGPNVSVIVSPSASISEYDLVLIDPQTHHTAKWSELLARCYLGGVEVLPWTRFIEIRLGRVDVASFDISHLSYSPGQLVYARLKRFLDILAVVVSLPLAIPVSAAIAIYIYARDGGPVLFVQHRIGYAGRPFRLYKFRTMFQGTSGGATSAADKRIIPGCRIMRRLRLDELPQLYNVATGDMSLIGPRPEAVDLVKWYRKEVPQYDYRVLVYPGLTGWAQVNNGYTSNPSEARIKLAYDLYYIKHLSFDLDLQILFRTVRTIVFGFGAR